MLVILWRLVNNILINSQMKLDSLLLTEKEKEKTKITRFVLFSSQSVFRGFSTQEPASITFDDSWSFFFSSDVGFALHGRL